MHMHAFLPQIWDWAGRSGCPGWNWVPPPWLALAAGTNTATSPAAHSQQAARWGEGPATVCLRTTVDTLLNHAGLNKLRNFLLSGSRQENRREMFGDISHLNNLLQCSQPWKAMLLEDFTRTVLHQHGQETETLKPETHVIKSIWSRDETKAATDLSFHSVMNFWINVLLQKKKKKVGWGVDSIHRLVGWSYIWMWICSGL